MAGEPDPRGSRRLLQVLIPAKPLQFRTTRGDAPSEFAATVSALAEWCSAFAAQQGPRLEGAGRRDNGAGQRLALKYWTIEFTNLELCIELAIQQRRGDWLVAIARELDHYLEISSGFRAMYDRYGALLTAARELGDRTVELYALLGLARAESRVGQFEQSRQLSHAALELARSLQDRLGEARSLCLVGSQCEDPEEATRDLERALEIYRDLDDAGGQMECLNFLAIKHYGQGDAPRARGIWEEVLRLSQQAGDRNREAGCLNNLALVAGQLQDNAAGVKLLLRALSINRELGNRAWEAVNLFNLAYAAINREAYRDALPYIAEAALIRRHIGDRNDLARCSTFAALILAHLGQFEAAAVIVHGVLSCALPAEVRLNPLKMEVVEQTLSLIAEAAEADAVLKAQLPAWQQRGEALALEELEELTVDYLVRARPLQLLSEDAAERTVMLEFGAARSPAASAKVL